MHDDTKCLMGSPGQSGAQVTVHDNDPASFPAGLKVNQGSGGLSVAVGAGMPLGVSLGRSLSDTKKTAVARCGERIPVLLSLAPARGAVEITDYAALVDGTDDTITIGGQAFTAQTGSASPTTATFQAASSLGATAISLAAQINAHVATALLVEASVNADGVTVDIVAKLNTTAGNAIGLTYEQLGAGVGATVTGAGTLTGGADAADYVVIGEKVYFSDVTGKADDKYSDSTISDAIYVSGVLTGIDEDGGEVAAALIDFPGGL